MVKACADSKSQSKAFPWYRKIFHTCIAHSTTFHCPFEPRTKTTELLFLIGLGFQIQEQHRNTTSSSNDESLSVVHGMRSRSSMNALARSQWMKLGGG